MTIFFGIRLKFENEVRDIPLFVILFNFLEKVTKKWNFDFLIDQKKLILIYIFFLKI